MNNIRPNNNFGVLRLFFAFLVILSHSSEIIDGNRSREILTFLFGSISLGELAVNCFFLMSGFLVTKSYYNSQSLEDYLTKRVLRIYPAFIVAFILSVIFFATLSGGWELINLSAQGLFFHAKDMFFLSQPHVQGVFKSNHYQFLNVAMWSIQYEFICYLIAPFFVMISFRKKGVFLTITILFALAFITLKFKHINFFITNPYFINITDLIRLITAFMVGGVIFLFRAEMRWDKRYSFISALFLIILLFNPLLAEIGLIVFGGYLLFNFALNYEHPLLNKIGTKHDISYGVYLYAWPIQSLFVQYFPSISPWQLFLISSIFASMLGYLSWVCIEKPFMRMKNNLVGTTPQIN